MKTISEKFKKLDDISHVLLRPGRYIGSINSHHELTYSYDIQNNKMVEEELNWCPALLKVFDEIITNSADFSKTDDGKHVNEIKVEIDKESGMLSVYDNGGIHVVIHEEHQQYIPEMIFELKAGSNFNDSEDNADNDFNSGQNGEGAALTVIFSTEFNVETHDGYNSFKQTHINNSREKTIPKIRKSTKRFTKISWIPDYPKFNMERLDEDNYKILLKRTIDIAGCNPHLKVYFNGTLLKIKTFEDYIKLYTDDFIYESNDDWKIGISKSTNSFQHLSFVNSSITKLGGPHVDYISNQIVNKVREHIKKKNKIDVKPADIKNHLQLFINCNIKRPRYSSQTKDNLITEIRNFGTEITLSDKFIKNVIKSDIIQNILDWVAAKERALEMQELRKHSKDISKKNPKMVNNFHDANTKDRSRAILFLCEGISALNGPLTGKGNSDIIGLFPLKGKPINVMDQEIKDIIENEEFKNILTITGLQIGVKVENINQLRFGKICFLSDQDLDGWGIRGLLSNLFYYFWPELFELGVMCLMNTPIIKVKYKKEVIPFYSNDDFELWKLSKVNEKYDTKYYKGLGSSDSKEWKEYLENINDKLVLLTPSKEDKDIFKLLFSKEKGMADERKEWLGLSK